MGTIELARAGRVTCRNHTRLGYDRVLRGVYGQGLALDGLDDWAAKRQLFWRLATAVMAAHPHKSLTLYGVSGLQALGVALPERLQDWQTCHVQVSDRVHRPQRLQVVAHRTSNPPPVWREVSGLPVPHPVDLWLQVREASNNDLIEIGDGLMRRQAGLLKMTQVEARLEELAGVKGVKRVRGLLRWVRPDTDSIYETRTRLVLVRSGLPCPEVDLEVFCRRAGRAYHVDMGYEAEKVAVEYDGSEHGNRRQMEIDAHRRRDLQDEGWLIITVTARQLDDPPAIVRSVEQALWMRRVSLHQAW